MAQAAVCGFVQTLRCCQLAARLPGAESAARSTIANAGRHPLGGMRDLLTVHEYPIVGCVAWIAAEHTTDQKAHGNAE